MAEITAEIQASAAVNAEIDCFPIRYVDCEDFEDTVADAVTDYLDENPPAGVDRYNKTEIDTKLAGKLDTTDDIFIENNGHTLNLADVVIADDLKVNDGIVEGSSKGIKATYGDVVAGEISLKKTAASVSELKSDLVNYEKQTTVAIDNRIKKFYTNNLGAKTLNDSDDGAIRDLKLYGKGSQLQTTGKNLYPFNLVEDNKTINGVSFNAVKDNNGNLLYIEANGTASDSVDYWILSGIKHDCSTNPVVISGSGNSDAYYVYSTQWATAVNDTTVAIGSLEGVYIHISSGKTLNNFKFYPMIRLASVTDSTYEPYTGGKPSPSPDYPQEIKSVVNPKISVCGGKYRSLLNDYQYNWLVENKNIWYGKKCVVHHINGIIRIAIFESPTSLYDIYITENTVYTGSHLYDYEEYLWINIYKGLYMDGHYLYGNNEHLSIDVQSTLNYPHEKQTATLNTTLNAIPVSSGGNVIIDGQQYIADYVDVENKQIVRMVGKVDLGDLNYYYFSTSDTIVGSITDIKPVSDFEKTPNILCENYKVIKWSGAWEKDRFVSCAPYQAINKAVHFYVTAPSPINFKNANKGKKLIYELATPTTEPLTDAQIKDFLTLRSYYPTTNVNVTSSQLDGQADFLYPCSIESGWEYIKEQLGDTRETVYNMSDISDTAYINAQYAEILAEMALD